MSVIEEYVLELDDTLSQIDNKLASKLFQDCDAILGQADDLLKQLSVEIRSLESNERKEKSSLLDDYKLKISNKRNELKNAKSNNERSLLFGNGNGNSSSSSSANNKDKERFITANDRLTKQNEIILNAQRTVAETEEVGAEISENLAMNREKIESSSAKVKELHADLDSADRITKSMVDRSKCIIS